MLAGVLVGSVPWTVKVVWELTMSSGLETGGLVTTTSARHFPAIASYC